MRTTLALFTSVGLLLTQAAAAAETAKQSTSTLKDVSELQSRKQTSNPETWPGAAVYRKSCSACHEGQVPKAPHKMFLQMMAPGNILGALEHGLMKQQGDSLSPADRKHVAEYLSATSFASLSAERPPPRCSGTAATFDASKPAAAVGWGYDNSRFVPAALAGISRDDVPRLKLKWAFAYPDAIRARSQPLIAHGAVYTGSHDGTVYAFDLRTGCVRWTYRASAEVRTAIVGDPDAVGARRSLLYFGDVIARVYAIDARTGQLVWSVKVDEHPNATITGSPAFHDGIVYVPISSLEVTSAADPKYECCKFRGAIAALDAASGALKWKTYSITEEPKPVRTTRLGTRVFAPSGAPIWNSPTIDASRGLIYAGTGENYSSPASVTSDAVLAFRMSDGKLMWSRQLTSGDAWNVGCMMADNPNCPAENGPDVDVAAGTILMALPGGKRVLIAGQKNGFVYALDPDEQGKLLWKTRVGRGGIQGGIHFGLAREGTRIYVPIVDMKDGHDGRSYDSPPKPGLYALDAANGRVLWSAPADDVCNGRPFCDPGISAAVTAIPGVVFAGHMDGRLRAYDGANGHVLWEIDSTRAVPTVSGAAGKGGSFGGAGAAIRDGYLAVNSGYGLYFHMPGGVLLVFTAGS
ncbi:MAG TPA: PQQ-binding-like beta-propeller repeat protein [Steroidobacteraceae bacterium]|nr:PQQ-binding-like beta-propeller repeat protein [Steroidobacteraceae bacterium]